jgi:hypothetical protein
MGYTGLHIKLQFNERNKWKMMINQWNPVDLGLPCFQTNPYLKIPKTQESVPKAVRGI